MAEKTNASPQNSAFESGTLQDSQCSMSFSEPDSKIRNISFRNGNVHRCFIIFGSHNENISSKILLRWADKERKPFHIQACLKAGTDKYVSKLIERQVIYSFQSSNVFLRVHIMRKYANIKSWLN